MHTVFSHRFYFLIDLCLLAALASLYNTPVFSFQHYEVRLVMFAAAILYLWFVCKQSGLTRQELGLTTTNTRAALKAMAAPAAILSILLVLARFLVPSWFHLGISYTNWSAVFVRLAAYSTISVFLQELAFRGYVLSRLKQFTKDPTLIILASALIFSFIHWPFGSLIMSIGTFFMGVLFARNFLRYRDLVSVMAGHILVGTLLLLCTVRIG